MDWAREWTDEQLEALEKRIADAYSQAAEEAARIEHAALKSYEREKMQFDADLKAKRISKRDYNHWMRGKAAELTRHEGMVTELTSIAHNANVAAAAMVNDELPRVFAENANYAAFYVDQSLGKVTGFDLVNRDAVARLLVEDPDLLPKAFMDPVKDVTWNRQKFSSAITQSILLGESVPHAVERLQNVVGMNERHATMLARTALTGAENGGREHTYDRAREKGIDTDYIWEATLDSRTRDSHIQLHGEVRDERTGEFSNGLKYPGDPNGSPEDVANCRCRLSAQVRGFARRDYTSLSSQWSDLPSGATYEEWKAGKYSSRRDDAKRNKE